MRRSLICLMLLVLGLAGGRLALLPSPARAAFDPGGEIVSVDNATDEQGDAGVIAASMTPDGRYVVFQTQAENFYAPGDPPNPPGATWAGGIFRYDRLTGALSLVADGDAVSDSDGSVMSRGASNPSISDDGRYVVFSSGQQLVPADTNHNVDVYVRDMTKPASDPAAYVIASARDGGSTPATYAHPDSDPVPVQSSLRNPGSEVWPGNAISGDGRFVVFRTVGWNSDLPSAAPPTGSSGTAPGQIFVRDLQTQQTHLITQVGQPGSGNLGDPAGGATGPAVISADGTTVAWLGGDAAAQTPFLNGESTDPAQHYYLLRRWQAASPATIRVTGLADPANPACPAGGTVSTSFSATGPCDGPLTGVEAGLNNYTLPAPALSADGNTIAYVATGELRPPPTQFVNPGFDLFVVNVGGAAYARGGLRAATIELTRAGNSTDSRATPPIDTVSMSRNGRFLGITTARVVFADPALSTVGQFRANADTEEGYLIDLGVNTIERVVTSAGGGDADGSVSGPLSLSSDGGLAAFVSAADNLISGDANGVADAFVAHRTIVNTQTASNPNPPSQQIQIIGSSPGGPRPPAFVTATVSGTGTLLLHIRVAGPGLLSAIARHGTVVARALGSASHAGTYKLVLKLDRRPLALLRKQHTFKVNLTVTWSPKAPKVPRKQALTVTFRVVKAKPKPKPRSKTHKSPDGL